MTRSKIFLGVTTAALAIAGVAAAKRITTVTRFYITANGTACHALPSLCNNLGTQTCLGTYTDGKIPSSQKQGVLWTQGGSATVVVPFDKCKTKLVYNGQL